MRSIPKILHNPHYNGLYRQTIVGWGGVGKINFGKQYRQGNRIYSAEHIAMCLTAQPVGNAGGFSYLYVVAETRKETEC